MRTKNFWREFRLKHIFSSICRFNDASGVDCVSTEPCAHWTRNDMCNDHHIIFCVFFSLSIFSFSFRTSFLLCLPPFFLLLMSACCMITTLLVLPPAYINARPRHACKSSHRCLVQRVFAKINCLAIERQHQGPRWTVFIVEDNSQKYHY